MPLTNVEHGLGSGVGEVSEKSLNKTMLMDLETGGNGHTEKVEVVDRHGDIIVVGGIAEAKRVGVTRDEVRK